MAFKIKDGVRIGTVDVFDNAGVLLVKSPGWITPRTVTFQDKTTAPAASTDVTGSFTIDGTANVGEVVLTLDTILSGTLKVNEPNVTYGSSSLIPVFTVDAKGRITAISETAASLQFTIAGDGSTSDVFQGGTVTVTGGTGIVTTVAETSTPTGTSITIALDSTDEVTFAGVTAGNISVGVTTDNTITTSSGGLTLDSTGGTVTVNDNLVVSGDLTVNGTTTTVNSTTITVDDKNIELGSIASPTDAGADGGGITLKGTTDKTILWIDSTDRWTFNQGIESTVGLQNTVIGNANPAAATFTDLTVNDNTTLGATTADNITLNGKFVTGTVLRSAQADTNTLSLAAYDVNGSTYVNLITLTASNTPTLALTSDGVGTINNMSIGATTASTGTFTQLTVNGSNLNTTISPTGTGTVTISPGGTLTLGTATKTTDLVGNVSATGTQTISLTPTGTVAISPVGNTLTLGTSGQTTSMIGNISATGTQTVTLSPTGTVAISPVGNTLTLGTSGQTTSILGNISAITNNQTVTLSPTGTGSVTISPAGSVTISPTTNVAMSPGGTVTINPTGALTINPTATGSISNVSISATTVAATSTISTTGSENATSQATGALRVDGGVSVDKDIYLSGNQVYATSGGTKIVETRAFQTTVSQNTEFVLNTFVANDYRYAIYQVQITQSSNIQISEVKIAHDGTTTYMTEYSVLETNTALAPAFTSDINGGNVRLKVTMTSANAATVNILRTLMVA